MQSLSAPKEKIQCESSAPKQSKRWPSHQPSLRHPLEQPFWLALCAGEHAPAVQPVAQLPDGTLYDASAPVQSFFEALCAEEHVPAGWLAAQLPDGTLYDASAPMQSFFEALCAGEHVPAVQPAAQLPDDTLYEASAPVQSFFEALCAGEHDPAVQPVAQLPDGTLYEASAPVAHERPFALVHAPPASPQYAPREAAYSSHVTIGQVGTSPASAPPAKQSVAAVSASARISCFFIVSLLCASSFPGS